jgi:hypothetical protein
VFIGEVIMKAVKNDERQMFERMGLLMAEASSDENLDQSLAAIEEWIRIWDNPLDQVGFRACRDRLLERIQNRKVEK